MNKVILMSIRPEWLVKILNGEKTIEIRKTIPKCELPIDVYLYCTKKWHLYFNSYENEWKTIKFDRKSLNPNLFCRSGKVVAKFTLNHLSTCLNTDYGNEEILKNACLTKQELDDYIGKRKFFAWHIDNLVVFDDPMGLRDFSFFKRETITCGMDCPPYTDWVEYRVRKAPQSWQYVYVEGERK